MPDPIDPVLKTALEAVNKVLFDYREAKGGITPRDYAVILTFPHTRAAVNLPKDQALAVIEATRLALDVIEKELR